MSRIWNADGSTKARGLRSQDSAGGGMTTLNLYGWDEGTAKTPRQKPAPTPKIDPVTMKAAGVTVKGSHPQDVSDGLRVRPGTATRVHNLHCSSIFEGEGSLAHSPPGNLSPQALKGLYGNHSEKIYAAVQEPPPTSRQQWAVEAAAPVAQHPPNNRSAEVSEDPFWAQHAAQGVSAGSRSRPPTNHQAPWAEQDNSGTPSSASRPPSSRRPPGGVSTITFG